MNTDGFVKSPSAGYAYRFFEAPHAPLYIIHAAFGGLHTNVSWGALHSSEFARLASGAFYCAVPLVDF